MGPLPELITPNPAKIIRCASVQGAQPLRDDGRGDVGGGAQRVPAVRGGLVQITVTQVSEGDVGLDYRLAADPPGLEALQRRGAQGEGLISGHPGGLGDTGEQGFTGLLRVAAVQQRVGLPVQ